jgi:hypothetical protein
LSAPSENPLEKKLTEDQLKVALYIYIGQNIRDPGILKQDSFLRQNTSVVRSLLDQKIIEEWRWYKFDVFSISYRYVVPLKGILEKKLRSKKDELRNTLKLIPPIILSFFVFEYLREDLSFSVKKEWLFDWRDILLENTTVNGYRRDFFKVLIDYDFCVRTRSYVSTRGGELRETGYVISAEVRKFLAEIIPHMQFPDDLRCLAVVHWLILGEIEYETRKIVDVPIREEAFEELGNDLDVKNVVDALLGRFASANVVEEIKRIPGYGWDLKANRRALLSFIKTDVQNMIVKQLLSEKPQVSEEEIKDADFLRLVRTLINRKFSVYKIAAQFAGKEIFKSLPSIERCVIDLTTPLQGEEGLRKFINDLHQILEESSRKEVLKFREGKEFTTLQEWLGIEIPPEASSFYEDAKSFFQQLNRLRNFYNHSVDAEGIFKTGLIFSKLIGKYSLEKDDILKTQVILLQKSIRALDNLQKALEIVWQKKMGT